MPGINAVQAVRVFILAVAPRYPSHEGMALPYALTGGGEEEDDVDLFGDDDDADADAAAELKAKAAQKAQQEKKGDKPPAKTNMILDVKGWDDETDMAKVEELVRAVRHDATLSRLCLRTTF
eukprot:3934813-Rhodomonas_salina.4